MDYEIPVYVYVRPGRTLDGLLALLRVILGIGAVQHVTGQLTELKLLADHKQALILLDANLADQELWRYINQLKDENFQTQYKCIALADNVHQQQMAKAAGADEVLLAGFPAEQLFRVIENLFNQTETEQIESERKNGAATGHQTA